MADKAENTVVENQSTSIMTITPQQLELEAQAVINRLGSVGNANIRLNDRKFIFPDGRTIDDEMDAVIVDFVYVNRMYEGPYNAKKPSSPICAAVSMDSHNMEPQDSSPSKQASSCKACPNNQYGSGGGEGKACKNEVWLAVIAANATDDSPMYIMKLSPTAITPFNKYVMATSNAFRVPLYGVVTHFSFDRNVSYSKILCSNPEHTRNPNIEQAMKRRSEAASRLSAGLSFNV